MGDKECPVYGGMHNIPEKTNQVSYRQNDYLQLHVKQAKNDYPTSPSEMCISGNSL